MDAVLHAPANRVRVLQNARTLLRDDSLDLVRLAIVAHAGGIDLLHADGSHVDRVLELIDNGVDVAACRRSMARQDVTADDLADGVRTVPSGMGELVRLQAEGYAYIRP